MDVIALILGTRETLATPIFSVLDNVSKSR